MNGVEAAASLFGSEESDSDLFATLGADTTSNQFSPANVFNLDEPSAPHKSNLSSELHFYSQPETSAFGEYTSPNHLSSGDNEHAQSYTGDWDEQLQKNIDEITYSNEVSPSFDPPPAEGSNQSYTPRPSLPQSNDSYLPPAIPATMNPVTTSSYSPHMSSNPPPPTRIVQEPPMQVSSTQSYNPQHTLPATTPYLGASSLPVTPNTKSTIARPKYSNAYDPPFIPSSSRRAGRSGGAQQAYNPYQQPSSPYIPAMGVVSNVSGNYHSQTTPYHAENNHASSESPPNQNYFAQPIYADNLDYPGANYTGDIALQSQRETNSYPSEHLDNAPGYSLNAHEDPYTSHRKGEAQHTHYTAKSNGAIDLSSSMKVSPPYQESVPTEVSSFVNPTTSSISTPPVSQYDLGTSAQADNLNGYVSQHMPPYKREVISGAKGNHDPYTPKVNHGTTNYIPRTSSPLSGFKNESKKLSNAPSNLSAQSSVSSIGVSPAVPMHAARSLNTANDTSRPISQRVDLRVGLPDLMKLSNTQYAPSPSLLGSNDPLARTSARAPVVTFGFGGKMVTCFHGMPGLNAGFDVALSSRASSELKVHILHKLLPASALSSPSSSYPGPLLYDSGTPSLSLVRPSLSAQTKAKKTAVVTYLSSRANEIDQGLGYLSNLEKRAAQGTLILVKLLKIMVENDGRLLGTPQAESAVRMALVPRLDGSATAIGSAVSTQAVYKSVAFDEPPLTVTMLRPSALDKIQELLLLGDRRQAYQFAMDEKLWAHAMVIASSIDKDSWKEVVNDFLRTELGIKDDVGLSPSTTVSSDPVAGRKGNWESLRVAYSLFSGQGAASVQELVPTNSLLQRATGGLQPLSIVTPRTPNFSLPQPPVLIPSESLSKWADTVAMMISSPLPSETSVALTAFGDQLLANNWIQAAHACYLLSPQTSLIGGLGSPSARISLLGSKNLSDAMKDPDALIFTEILEFAMTLAPASKGQETALSYLQAYRFIRAASLAESGNVQLATRYCEAISVSLNHTSPHTTNALLEQLQGLSQRLIGVHTDKAGSWIGGKLSKPSLDTIGGWLEGRFTKLVTGDNDTAAPTGEETKSRDRPFVGPFAHYSTISSTTPSARSSPQPSFSNFNLPPPRTSSAMGTSSEYPQVPIERSMSASGYIQQKPGIRSSTPPLSSSQSSPIVNPAESHVQLHDPYGSKSRQGSISDKTETTVQGTWWGSGEDNSNRTPTAATFMQVDESAIQSSADGFISLMDSHSFSVGPQQETSSFSQQEDEDDDLGLGNSKQKPIELELDPEEHESTTPVPKSEPVAPPKAEAQAPAGGGSWFGRWWKKGDGATPTGPVKASLGEENAFYYDKEQKRWVNKKAGSEETPKPALPPPPSRAQTASPGMSGSRVSPASGPPRSASAIDLGSEPSTNAPIRVRSRLAPSEESAPVTPTGPRFSAAGPPLGSVPSLGSTPPLRPKSQAAKRNIRSRYVDVFQQEAGGDA